MKTEFGDALTLSKAAVKELLLTECKTGAVPSYTAE